MLRNWIGICAACLATGCTGAGPGTDAQQDARLEAVAADVSLNWDAQEAKLNELEARVAALEADRAKASTTTPGPTGTWIAWKVEQLASNPQQILFGVIKPEPMHAFSSQAECQAESNRVAAEYGGDPATPAQYIRPGMNGSTWLVVFRCLPKEIDPRD